MNPPSGKKTIPLIVLAIGVLFVTFHILVNGAAWIKSSFTPIAHPSTYRFATYDKLLHEVVKGDSVDYTALKKSPLLDKAVDELAVVSPDKLENDLSLIHISDSAHAKTLLSNLHPIVKLLLFLLQLV